MNEKEKELEELKEWLAYNFNGVWRAWIDSKRQTSLFDLAVTGRRK